MAEETLLQLAKERGKQVSVHLFGQEINAETYAICKADLLLTGLLVVFLVETAHQLLGSRSSGE